MNPKDIEINQLKMKVARLEKIADGLCSPEGSAKGDKAYSDWINYSEENKKELEK